MRGVGGEFSGAVTLATALSYLVAFAAMLFVHELLHAVALPAASFGAATTVGFWPNTLTPYVSYEGELPRNRHVLVGVMPFFVLSIVPIVLGFCFSVVPRRALRADHALRLRGGFANGRVRIIGQRAERRHGSRVSDSPKDFSSPPAYSRILVVQRCDERLDHAWSGGNQ